MAPAIPIDLLYPNGHILAVVLVDPTTGNIVGIDGTGSSLNTTGGGGGGGAVTIADGADVAEGHTTDSAWDGIAAAATVIAILKKMATSGTGGGPATIADGADVAEGHIADVAWGGSGNGTVIALLKALYAELAGKLLVTADPITFASPQAVTNTNLDVALSTRLAPADTLTKVATVDTITNPVTVTGSIGISGTVSDSQVAEILTPSTLLQSANSGTGVGTPMSVVGYSHVRITVSTTGSPNFTWDLEATEDGVNFFTIPSWRDGAPASSWTISVAPPLSSYFASVRGFRTIRANISSNSGGTPVTITATATPIADLDGEYVSGAVDQKTPSIPFFVNITDIFGDLGISVAVTGGGSPSNLAMGALNVQMSPFSNPLKITDSNGNAINSDSTGALSVSLPANASQETGGNLDSISGRLDTLITLMRANTDLLRQYMLMFGAVTSAHLPTTLANDDNQMFVMQ